jgi:two-component system, OmpR family, response regulator
MDKPKLIFIVDDDPIVNLMVAKRFTSEGYKVDTFDYGEGCIKALVKNPDLIILDYYFVKSNQKVMNGMEIFEKIKEVKPRTPVIMLSGQEKGEIVLELARKGIVDYIIKDNNLIDNLLAATRELFEK